MKIHVLTECWGIRPDEVSVKPYADPDIAIAAFKKCVENYVEGSRHDVDAVVDRAVANNYTFTCGYGFFSLEPMEVLTA